MYKESNKCHYAVLKIKENYQPALRDIGTNNLMLLNFESAENYLTKSLKLNPLDYICLNSLGVVKMRLDRAEEAKKLDSLCSDLIEYHLEKQLKARKLLKQLL